MALKIYTLAELDIPTAGTRVQASATSTIVSSIIFQADTANTGNIFVGDVNVTSTRGYALTPGDSIAFSGDMAGYSGKEFILSDFYVDTATNGNDVWITYVAPK